MNVDSFCRAVLLKRAYRADEVLTWLPDEVREEVKIRLDELQSFSEAELRSQWKVSRAEEVRTDVRLAKERSGVDVMRVSPRHRAMLVRYLSE